MSEAIEKVQPAQQIQKASPFEPQSMEQAMKFSEWMSKAGLVPDALKGKPADIMIVLLAAHDFGLTLTEGLRAFAVIKGKLSLGAAYKVARSKQHPDCEFFNLIESDAQHATWEAKRRSSQRPERLTWTIEMAKRAGLGGDNWSKYPETMLRWRCGASLADAVFSDAFFGMPTKEEIESQEAVDVEPIPVEGPGVTRTQSVKAAVLATVKAQTKSEVSVREKLDAEAEARIAAGETGVVVVKEPEPGEDIEPGASRHD